MTRPLVEEFDVVREVRGLGLMWAIEFGEPEKSGRLSWRMIERMQPGLFAQFVVAPLFSKHKILSQVAGHRMAVLKALSLKQPWANMIAAGEKTIETRRWPTDWGGAPSSGQAL